MLGIGDEAPDFSGRTGTGRPFTLNGLRGHRVALYFFPKAGSPGCAAETRGFARHQSELEAAGATVVGVSVDSVDAEGRFGVACGAAFPLVADPDGAISRQYGVRGLLGLARRVTFLLDEQGRVLEVIRGPRPGPHVRRTLERFVGPGASRPDSPRP